MKSFKSVDISADRTLREREAEKKLLVERRRRMNEGQDVVIYRGEVVLRSSFD